MTFFQAYRRWVVGGAGALVVLVLLTVFRRGDSVQYLTSKVQQGEIRDAVDATGTVNAVITVQVGSQVSGTIAKLNVDFNSRVHKGEVVAVIDPTLLQGALLQATADLENAKASVAVAHADLARATATLGQTKRDYDRATTLAKTGVITQQELDLATANYASAQAAVDAATAGVAQAQAQVTQKEAAVAVARTNLDHTVIRSPIDGIVVARNVDVGQTVAASLQAPTVFTIAQDLTKMQVYASVDESDVGRIKARQAVTFKVDAFPRETFHGVVSQIRMNPTTIQNVVTYNAVVDFANPDMKLFPGMTAYVTIPVATVENALKLPNAAIRFKPPPSTVHGAIASEPDARDDRVTVWKLVSGSQLVPVRVSLGITDHAYTQVTAVLAGELRPGDDVVTTAITSRSGTPTAQGLRR